MNRVGDWQVYKEGDFVWRLGAGVPLEMIALMRRLREGRLPGVDVIKENPKRTVFRLTHNGKVFYAKWHRFRGLWDVLSACLRGTRAAREWRMALALRERGVPTAAPRLLGQLKRRGFPLESFLVTAEVPGMSFKQLWGQLTRPNARDCARRHELTESLAAFVKMLHLRGVHHPDLHASNIVVTESNGEFNLLDLHAVSVRGRVGFRRRLQNVAFLCNSMGHAAPTATDRLRFLKAYLCLGATPQAVRDTSEAIGRKAERLHVRHVRSRSRRCVVRSSLFTHERTDGSMVYRRREISLEQVLEILGAHCRTLSLGEGGTVAKRSLKTNVTLLEGAAAAGLSPLYVKEFVRPGLRRFLPRQLRHRPAMVSWKAAHGLAVRGIGGPTALAVVLGRGASSYLIMRAEQKAEPLAEYVRRAFAPGAPSGTKRDFIRAAAGFLRACYSAGVLHLDMKASNVLVRETGDGWSFILLDLAAVRFHKEIPFSWKLINLAQLNASTPLALSWTDRLRLLRHLAQEERTLYERPAVNEIARLTRGRGCIWAG